jgi:xanthine dehydrogenase accessory factor
MNEPILNLLQRAAVMKRAGQRVVACLLVKARGSTPQSAGALMLVDEDANTFGTVGGGCVEAEIRRRAHALLVENGSGLLRFKLDHDYGWDDGLICGGTIDMAVAQLPQPESLDRIINAIRRRRATQIEFQVRADDAIKLFTLELPPRDRLYIAGGGHVGQALARLALPLEFDVTIFDDRADLLEQHAPPGCTLVGGDIAVALADAAFDDRTYAVVVTRGHRHDEQALHAVLGRGARYVGMIGSKRKVKLIFDDLIERGLSAELLSNVHAPIGLDIGGVTVEEIAISIAAQIVECRRAGDRSPVTEKPPFTRSHEESPCPPSANPCGAEAIL